MKSYFVAIVAMALLFVSHAFETNIWQGTTGGNWGDPANWSLGRVPTADDFTRLPYMDSSYSINVDGNYEIRAFHMDEGAQSNKGILTLTGAGTILSSGAQENYMRSKRALVLNGASLVISGNHLMVYGTLTIKNGSVFRTIKQNLTLWKNSPSIYVEDGGTVVVDGILQNNHSALVAINGGSFSVMKKVSHYDGTDGALQIEMTRGDFSIKDMMLSNSSSINISGGRFAIGGVLNIDETVTLDLTGGVVSFALPNVAQRILSENKGAKIEYVCNDVETRQSTYLEQLNGGTLIVNSSSDVALNLWPHNGTDENGVPFPDKVVEVSGTLVMSNGCINAKRKGTIISDYPVFIRGFRIDEGYYDLTIAFPEIVIGGEYPFMKVVDDNRNFYLEGPTTFKLTSDVHDPSGVESFVFMSGDCKVDTSDYYDPSVKRKMILRGFAANASASLAVYGGGELELMQAHAGSPFTKVEVGEGTTLTLSELPGSTSYGPLHTDEIVLGKDSVLNIPAGFNSVRAAKWTVDSSAKINIIFADGLATDAIGLLYDISGDYRVPENQIYLKGAVGDASGGWYLASGDGCWIATNSFANVAPENGFEWVGEGENDEIATYENWYCGEKPIEKASYVFGASIKRDRMKFFRVYRTGATEDADGDPKGSSVNSFRFRNTATSSFTIYNAQPTLTWTGEYDGAGLSSFSAVPQYIESSLRTLARHSLCAAAEGPLVFKPYSTFVTKFNTDDVLQSLVGDVRFGKNIIAARVDFGKRKNEYANRSPGSRLTVLDGGRIQYTNQHAEVAQAYTGFRVEEGGELKFENGSGKAVFLWKAGCNAYHTVNGVMDINIPCCGGGNQSFCGEGELNLHSFVPSNGVSYISFGGNLSVNLPAEWPTITANASDKPLTFKVYGTPVFRTEGDWTYGVFEEVANPIEIGKRAAEICKGATLTFDPNGGNITFEDPLHGKGTIVVTNGTLRIPGGVTSSIGVEVRDSGVYEWSDAHELRSLVCAAGSKLRFSGPITVKERVNLNNVNIEWAEGASPERAKSWMTLFISMSGFEGEIAALNSNYYTRIVETSNGYEYQIRPKIGMTVTFR